MGSRSYALAQDGLSNTFSIFAIPLHNLRHSLSNWLVNKAKVEPKTVHEILRHAKSQTTLDLHTQEESDETLVAQGVGSSMVQ
jgi:integrase